jgi:glycosyltransferase involved in cell wall biosynthesis
MGPRIAIDIGPLVGPRTGVGVAVAYLMDALRDLDTPPELVPYLLSYRADLPEGALRLPYPAGLAHRMWRRLDHPRADRPLERPSLIHGTNYVVPAARCPRLVTVYDTWFLRHPDLVHPDVARAGAVLRRAVSRGTTVHVSSLATAEHVRELLRAERVDVIHLGTVPAEPAPDDAPERVRHLSGRPYVLALGTLEPRKNIGRLVDAFGRLEAVHPDVELVLAGGGADGASDVAAAVFRLPPSMVTRVHQLGRVDAPTKAWLLHNATVLAYPSLDEGFGFPLLEAMSVDVPVVASTAGSIPEIAGDAALLVDPLDVDALAGALDRVLSDDTLRLRLAFAGRARAARYSWRTTALKMADLYSELAMDGAGS